MTSSGIETSIFWLVAKIRDIAVGIATGYEIDYRGVGVRVPLE
jgi:hypothetical protein